MGKGWMREEERESRQLGCFFPYETGPSPFLFFFVCVCEE